ncbi:MAG: ROK family protein [Bacteroidota bacterium]
MAKNTTRALGIDVGGSGVKGAVVNVSTGELVTERFRIPTPSPPTTKALSRTVGRMVEHFAWKGPIGCGMPGPFIDGRLVTAVNLHSSWVGAKAEEIFSKACGRKVRVINDADAAGLAAMRFGAGRGKKGVVVLLTLGTGIGSAVFLDGKLLPNTEFGQMELRGKPGEQRAAARVRKDKDLTWDEWAERLNEYVCALERLIWPDLIILGGGVSRKADRFIPLIKTRARVVAAELMNEAGIIGAALASTRKRSS